MLEIGDKVMMNDNYRVSEVNKGRYLLLEQNHKRYVERYPCGLRGTEDVMRWME